MSISVFCYKKHGFFHFMALLQLRMTEFVGDNP